MEDFQPGGKYYQADKDKRSAVQTSDLSVEEELAEVQRALEAEAAEEALQKAATLVSESAAKMINASGNTKETATASMNTELLPTFSSNLWTQLLD